MLRAERSYEFRQRIDAVHHAGMNDLKLPLLPGEVVIDNSWHINLPAGCNDPALVATARDLEDYFHCSMELDIPVKYGCPGGISLTVDPTLDLQNSAFELEVKPDTVIIRAATPGGVRRGGVYLEDTLNLRGRAALSTGVVRREKLISPRIVHSGWGIELFPDSHLNAIMHAGFDAIAVFCRGENETNIGYLDFNDL